MTFAPFEFWRIPDMVQSLRRDRRLYKYDKGERCINALHSRLVANYKPSHSL